MLLNNKQSLILCGILSAGIFVAGIFNILDNFIVLAILFSIFITIIANIIYVKSKQIEEDLNQKQQKNS